MITLVSIIDLPAISSQVGTMTAVITQSFLDEARRAGEASIRERR
jgi:hypothetical protein